MYFAFIYNIFRLPVYLMQIWRTAFANITMECVGWATEHLPDFRIRWSSSVFEPLNNSPTARYVSEKWPLFALFQLYVTHPLTTQGMPDIFDLLHIARASMMNSLYASSNTPLNHCPASSLMHSCCTGPIGCVESPAIGALLNFELLCEVMKEVSIWRLVPNGTVRFRWIISGWGAAQVLGIKWRWQSILTCLWPRLPGTINRYFDGFVVCGYLWRTGWHHYR